MTPELKLLVSKSFSVLTPICSKMRGPSPKTSGKPINGILYGAYDGQTWWGPTTTSSNITDRAPAHPGAQIAYQVADPSKLTVEIADSSGKAVRSLRKDQTVQPGYHVEVWDGKDDAGVQLPDKPYTIRFQSGNQTVAQSSVSIS